MGASAAPLRAESAARRSHADSARRAPAAFTPAPVTGGPVLQRTPHCACGGGCPRCQEHQTLQPKFNISTPGDSHEQEADRVAEQVMRTPASKQGPELNIRGRASELQRRPRAGGKMKPNPPTGRARASARVGEVLQSAGSPLEGTTQQFMETRFGRSFADVRIHTGALAAESAHAVGALAYTVGNHVVFGRDQYDPSSKSGQRLIAHELAHTIQQSDLTAPGQTDLQPALIQRQSDEETSPVDSGEASEQNAGANANEQGGEAGSELQNSSDEDISGRREPESCRFGNRSLPYPFTFSGGVTFWSDIFSLGNASSVSLSISANYEGSPNITNYGSYCVELYRCRGLDFFPPWSGGSGQGQQCRQLSTSGTLTWSGLNRTHGHYFKIWKGSGDSFTMSGRGNAT